MPANIKLNIKEELVVKDLKKFTKELKLEITEALDPVLSNSVDDLKATLTAMLDKGISLYQTLPDGTKKLPPGLNVPKSDADIIKYIFDEDISQADFIQKRTESKTIKDTSKIFVYENGRIKNWQSVTDSSTYAGQEMNFRNRLAEGFIIDAKTGELFKPRPDDIKGVKLECSKDTGQTVDSEKKFEAYKNSANISRRKYDAPFSRTAVWTIKQADAKNIVENSLPLQKIIEKIQQGQYELAMEFFSRNNVGGNFSKVLERIENLKNGTNLSEELLIKQRINALIRNLKIRKNISQYKTRYTLISNYDTSIQESENNFFELLKREIFLWKVSNQDKLIKEMIKAINKVIARYSKSTTVE